MTNKEKYYNKIMDYVMAGTDTAVDKDTGKLVSCGKMACSQCKFNKEGMACIDEKLIWLNEEYIEPEPETDWSKVEVDTPILVRSKESQAWEVRYFAKYKDGKVWCWDNGKTSYTSICTVSIYNWNFSKLPTSEELEQYRKKA